MEAAPKVTKEYSKTSAKEQYSSAPWERITFEDSEAILVCRGKSVRLSLDNGENWRTTLETEEDIEQLIPDEFHKSDRAFVEDYVGHLYITGNQGRDWMKLQKPSEVEKTFPNIVATHPFEKNYLLLDLKIEGDEFDRGWISGSRSEERIYISKDCGRNFKPVLAPVEDYDMTPDVISHGTNCWFSASSCNSVLSRNLIYGLHHITAVNEQGLKTFDKRTLFYSADFGKTTKLVEELKDFSVSRLQIFSHGVVVATKEGIHNRIPPEKLWISTGGPFKEAFLPAGLEYSSFGEAFEADFGRVLLPVYTTETAGQRKLARLLISDFETFMFSQFDSIFLCPQGRLRIKKLGNCGGPLLAQIFGVFPQEEESQKSVSYFDGDNQTVARLGFVKYLTVVSLDNGNSWSRLKLTDPSNKYRRFVKCSIDDLETCSLHICRYSYSKMNNSMSQVIMAKGAVLHSNSKYNRNECMSFISRDNGANWELAFEFPVYSVFANTGNIIVSIPQQQDDPRLFYITKIFFSLDNGRTWSQYKLGESVSTDLIELDTSDSSVIVKLAKIHEGMRTVYDNYILYTLDFSQLLGVQSVAGS